MALIDHFQQLQLTGDQRTALEKISNFLSGPTQVFILKGYAGTGKTTLLNGLMAHLLHLEKKFMAMAPTGRAAKILKRKTGFGKTIHRSIYNLEKLESLNEGAEDVAEHDFHYYFPIVRDDNEDRIIIVDEASMVSSRESKQELFTFGTDVVLNDLLTFARLKTSRRKVIFIGDPAQLPPVGDRYSFALEKSFFEDLEISCEDFTLTEVVRQQDNSILRNSMVFRHAIENPETHSLQLEYDQSSFIQSKPEELVDLYTSLYPNPEPNEGAIISFTNAQAHWNNYNVRERLFPGARTITTGDLLLITHNVYNAYPIELSNGDIVKVMESDPVTQKISAPVFIDENGIRRREVISLEMRKISILYPGHPDEIKVLIIDTLLNSIDRDLSIAEMKMLYIHFVMRFRESQNTRKALGMPYHEVGSVAFRDALKTDPYFNALRVKYGYGITCHKAQGGEWDKVIVDYHGRISLKSEPLRWCYTATTRAVNTVYAINAPHFGPLSRFSITPIGSIGTLSAEALTWNHIVISPYHTQLAHKCKSQKYWEVFEKLENTEFRIDAVHSFEFMERYFIRREEEQFILEGHHTGSGHFRSGFHLVNLSNSPYAEQITRIFNQQVTKSHQFNYTASLSPLEDLYCAIQDFCAELEIPITNVIEYIDRYYVQYFLITDSICSYIQFYFNGQHELTRAMPKTYDCPNDIKLQQLLQKLQEYAIQRN